MSSEPSAVDAVVIGSGPNGLAAAIELARNGKEVVVYEAASTPGGGTRTAELTLPGFKHDVCSAIHPMIIAAPFFRSLPLNEHGLTFAHPEAPLAHPLDDGSVAMLERSLDNTAMTLGPDAKKYIKLFDPLVKKHEQLVQQFLGPPKPPRHPLVMARFGLKAIQPARSFATRAFRTDQARAIFGGMAAHSMLALDQAATAGIALILGILAHAVGWPAAREGSGSISRALVSYLESLGGRVVTDHTVTDLDELPSARAYLFDTSPRGLLAIAGDRISGRYRGRLEKFRYGPGVFKMDWAVSEPIPWKNPEVGRAGTVHLGGPLPDIVRSESDVTSGRIPEKPFVLVAQQSVFDNTRAPAGKHTVWAYCHVPSGCDEDMTGRIEAQMERFAPGFKDTVLETHKMSPKDLHSYNANYIGGDINGGIQDLRQFFTRPSWRPNPYTTPAKDIYICSASSPPGGGVHGMCGYHAARAALKRAFA